MNLTVDNTEIKNTLFDDVPICNIEYNTNGVTSYVWRSPLHFVLSYDKTEYSVAKNPNTNFDSSTITTIAIPDTFNGLPVTSIANNAFENFSKLTSVTIGNNVKYIGEYTFNNCSSLADVSIGSSVTTIKACAFKNCTNLTDINLPKCVTVIGSQTFNGCTNLANVSILGQITEIGYGTFYNCNSLTNIDIPNSVTTIGEDAFYNCTSLTRISIPEMVTSIKYHAFSGCKNIEDLYFNAISMNDLGSSTSIFYGVSGIKNVTIGKKVTKIPAYLLYGSASSVSNITFEDSSNCKSIGKYSFSGCCELTSISIPDTIVSIGDNAFSSCGLRGIIIPDNVTSIGIGSFQGCTYLQSITIPFAGLSTTATGINSHFGIIFGSPSTIADSSYHYHYYDSSTSTCYKYSIPESLKSVIVTNTVNSYAFQNCTNFTSITISNNITYIGSNAFRGCTNITSITIPESIVSIDSYAFFDCTAVESINFNAVAMNDLTNGNDVFGNVGRTGVGMQVTVGKNVTRIPAYLFNPEAYNRESSPLISSITFEPYGKCKSIGARAFMYGTFTSINIPSNVIEIGENAFWYCDNLTSISISSSIWKCARVYDNTVVGVAMSSLTALEVATYFTTTYKDYTWTQTSVTQPTISVVYQVIGQGLCKMYVQVTNNNEIPLPNNSLYIHTADETSGDGIVDNQDMSIDSISFTNKEFKIGTTEYLIEETPLYDYVQVEVISNKNFYDDFFTGFSGPNWDPNFVFNFPSSGVSL